MNIPATTYSYFPSTYTLFSSSPQTKAQKIWESFKNSIGSVIRDAFFLPLAGKLTPYIQKRLQKEVVFCQDFWNPEKPLNPHLPSHEEIRKQFVSNKETQSIEVNGKKLQVEYAVIESKPSNSKTPQNLVFVLGSTSTPDNNIISIYPFLASFAEKAKQDPSIAPLRVIAISQYGTFQEGQMYKAKTLDESGQILTETLKSITHNKGPLKQIVAHSLGTIILAAALKYATQEKGVLPLNLYFDRGPSSIEKTSKKLGIQGWVASQLAKFSGWDIDLGLEIKKHLSDRPKQTVFISEVPNDHHFPGDSSLQRSPHLENLGPNQGFQKLSFDFADQLHHLISHHNMHNGFLDGYHLVPRQFQVLENHETMADKIMQRFTKPKNSISYFNSLLNTIFS